jgi:hypothetical protein
MTSRHSYLGGCFAAATQFCIWHCETGLVDLPINKVGLRQVQSASEQGANKMLIPIISSNLIRHMGVQRSKAKRNQSAQSRGERNGYVSNAMSASDAGLSVSVFHQKHNAHAHAHFTFR